MPTLFDPATAAATKARVQQLRPQSERQWGSMNAAQAAAHCAAGIGIALGDQRPPRMLAGRLFGRIIKPLALGSADMRRNTPTVPSMVMADERDLATERQRLCDAIDRFTTAGPTGCTTHPHSFFGPLAPEEWATLMYKHLDHHLRQFGA